MGIVKAIAGAIAVFVSLSAFGQQPQKPAGPLPSQNHAPMSAQKMATPKRTAPFGQVIDAVEARPIFNSERNILSFPIGFGISAEAEIRGKWSWTAELDHFQLGRKVLSKDDGFYVQDVPFERHYTMSTAGFGGVRYYVDPGGDSFYTGARLGFRRVDATYQFGDSDVLEVAHYAPLVLESGYRVVVNENFAVRVGARVTREYRLSQQLQNKVKSDDALKLEAHGYEPESIVDMGFGFYF